MTKNEIDQLFNQGDRIIYIFNEKNEIVRPHIAHNQLSGIAEYNQDRRKRSFYFLLHTTQSPGKRKNNYVPLSGRCLFPIKRVFFDC